MLAKIRQKNCVYLTLPSGTTIINSTRIKRDSYYKLYCPHAIDLETIKVSEIFNLNLNAEFLSVKCNIVSLCTLASAL